MQEGLVGPILGVQAKASQCIDWLERTATIVEEEKKPGETGIELPTWGPW